MTYASFAHLHPSHWAQCSRNLHSNSARVASICGEIEAACIGQAEAFTNTRMGPTNRRRHQSGLRAYRIIRNMPNPNRNTSSTVIVSIARAPAVFAMTVRFDTDGGKRPILAQLHSEAA